MPSPTWNRWEFCQCEIYFEFGCELRTLFSYNDVVVFFAYLSVVCVRQFYCSKDKEYNDLATIFFNTQVKI